MIVAKNINSGCYKAFKVVPKIFDTAGIEPCSCLVEVEGFNHCSTGLAPNWLLLPIICCAVIGGAQLRAAYIDITSETI